MPDRVDGLVDVVQVADSLPGRDHSPAEAGISQLRSSDHSMLDGCEAGHPIARGDFFTHAATKSPRTADSPLRIEPCRPRKALRAFVDDPLDGDGVVRNGFVGPVSATDVGIARNGPPNSVLGLGSQLSSCESPPAILKTTTRFCVLASSAAALG